jgi:hypothetical protein
LERVIEFPVASLGVRIVPFQPCRVEQRDVGAGEGDVSGANVAVPVGALAGVGVLPESLLKSASTWAVKPHLTYVKHEFFLDANPAPTPPPIPAAIMQNSKTTNAQNIPKLNPSILLVTLVPFSPSADSTIYFSVDGVCPDVAPGFDRSLGPQTG